MTKQQTARGQLAQFLSALFLREELIELRFIESWLSDNRKGSRVVRSSEWLRPGEFIAAHGDLTAFARRERANIYFGVCPRAKRGDADDHSIQTIRCVWCDIDRVSTDEAHKRWSEAGIPCPSIVVSSGSGVHGYWLLQQDLTSQPERSEFVAMLQNFYRSFGGDHVQNLSRILRPPGTVNYKDARNGRPPLPCSLCFCDPDVRYLQKAAQRADARWRFRPTLGSAVRQKEGWQVHAVRHLQQAEFESPKVILQSRQAGVGRLSVLGAQGAAEFPATEPENDAKRVAALLDGCHVPILPVGCGKNQRHKSNAKATLSPICPQSSSVTTWWISASLT